MSLTAARLRELVRYDPETGVFTRAVSRCRWKAGEEAGYMGDHGYPMVKLDGHAYRAHRLAWLYMTGAWPEDEIDHRDQCKTNNRWLNLRESTRGPNQQNQRRAQRHNKLGVLGVSANGVRFKEMLRVDGHLRYLGTFDTTGQAHAAYVEAKRIAHPGCTL